MADYPDANDMMGTYVPLCDCCDSHCDALENGDQIKCPVCDQWCSCMGCIIDNELGFYNA
jgi:hypothetical protein